MPYANPESVDLFALPNGSVSRLLFASLLALSNACFANVATGAVFGSHMVLQRDAPIPVFGTAANGESVSVTLGSQTKNVVAPANGKWSLKLDPMAAGGPHTMTIKGNNTITYYEKGQLPPAVQAHQEVMDHYGLPSINVGRTLYGAIKAGKGTLATFTADGTHPNDAGYKIYATEIQRVLQKFLVPQNPSEFVSWEWPTKTLTPKPLENGLVLKGEDAISAGWSKTAVPDTRFPGGIQANKAGTVLKYAFTGTAIGVHWNEGTSSGDVTWSVDGSTPTKASAYLSKDRGRLRVFTNSLEPGNHVLTLTVLPTKNAASTGTWIRINALMSNPPRIPASISGETTPSQVRGVQPALVDVSAQGTGVRFRQHGTFDALGKSVR